ncbi:hypothetical protein V6N13_052779 [Hibiscus sabdariffa]
MVKDEGVDENEARDVDEVLRGEEIQEHMEEERNNVEAGGGQETRKSKVVMALGKMVYPLDWRAKRVVSSSLVINPAMVVMVLAKRSRIVGLEEKISMFC